MRVFCLKNIRLTNGKSVRKGSTIDLDHNLAVMYINMGAVEPARLAEVRENPSQPVGEPLSALPAGQASQQTIVKESASGKKRGRPKKGER